MNEQEDKREYDDDDGHVIANMNVDGMPWYRKKEKWDVPNNPNYQYTKEERRYIILGTIKAALLIAAAFIAGGFVIILLLCIVSWLRY